MLRIRVDLDHFCLQRLDSVMRMELLADKTSDEIAKVGGA